MGRHEQLRLIETDEAVTVTPGAPTWPALTVRQPHAWGLIHGSKRVENRTWTTAYRGPLVIHAGASRADLAECVRYPELLDPASLRYGVPCGVVELYDVVPIGEAGDLPYARGPWCWLTRDPRPCEPLRWRGAQGLFAVPTAAVRFAVTGGPGRRTRKSR